MTNHNSQAGRTAKECAVFLLQGFDLSDWQIEFLAVALDEVAENYGPSVTDKRCLNELVQMNSQHRGSIEGVAHAVFGLTFKCSWSGEYGSRLFTVEEFAKRPPIPHAQFAALHAECGWGSDAHRRALGALAMPESVGEGQ